MGKCSINRAAEKNICEDFHLSKVQIFRPDRADTLGAVGVRQVRQTFEEETTKPIFSGEERGQSDGTLTRGLQSDRPDKSEG